MTTVEVTPTQLTSAIDEHLTSVNTQSLDLSFNELLDMQVNGELDISPDYQRLFQWSEGARSRFIESLLLEMPVPPIYVIEDDDGKYLLIDGLQRISSYLHFRGALTAEHFDPPIDLGNKLVLVDCDIVEELNGKTWDDLGVALQIRLKRSFVRVEVIRRGSDPKFKYHMFKRLNTGGELLTDQQLRNCTIRLLDPKFNDFIKDLAKKPDFVDLVRKNISDKNLHGAYDEELILRLFTFKNARDEFVHDIRDFLTEYMEKVSDPESDIEFDFISQGHDFNKTFSVLKYTLGENAFGSINTNKDALNKGFLVYHFEAFTVGLQEHLEQIDLTDADKIDKLKKALFEVKCNDEFINATKGGGKNSPGPLKKRISFVEDAVRGVYGS